MDTLMAAWSQETWRQQPRWLQSNGGRNTYADNMQKLTHEAIIIRNHMIRKLKNKTFIGHINNASPPQRKATTASSITAEHTQQARLSLMCTQRVAPRVRFLLCPLKCRLTFFTDC